MKKKKIINWYIGQFFYIIVLFAGRNLYLYKTLCLNIRRGIQNKKLRKEKLSGTVKNAMLCIYSFIRELNHIKLHKMQLLSTSRFFFPKNRKISDK